MAATTKGATGAAGGAGADAVLLEAAATALPAAVAGVLVRGVKKVAAACFFCTAAAVLATSDFFAFFAFDLAPSFAPRVRPIAQSKRRAKDLAKDSTRVEQEPSKAFLRLRWRQINFAEKGEKGKEEGEGRGRKEEGRKEGV